MQIRANLGVYQANSKLPETVFAVDLHFYVFHIDSYEDHSYGHIETGHNSEYWKMAIMDVMFCLDMAINMVFIGVFSKVHQKCRSTVKTGSKNMPMVKSYGQKIR